MHDTTNQSFPVPVSTNSNTTNKSTNRQTEPTELQQHQGQQTQQNDDDSEMADCDTEEEVCNEMGFLKHFVLKKYFWFPRFLPLLSAVSEQSITSNRLIKFLSSHGRTVKTAPQYNTFKPHRLLFLHRSIRQRQICTAQRQRQVLH